MIEEAEHPFPPPEDGSPSDESHSDPQPEQIADEPNEPDDTEPGRIRDIPVEGEETNDEGKPPLVASSSTGSDGDTTGPSTAENSISQAPSIEYEPKQIVGGRASIPEELEPHQLARLKDLKESNA